MPTYDLVCRTCGHEEELFTLSIVDKPGIQCPTCLVDLEKKASRVTAIFKGSGFYATEHGKSQANAYRKDKQEISDREAFIEEAKQGAKD